ncbi:MAG: redoxin domain-containing protein [Nitrosopumilus sp.]|nr:redoxin domain-containing protein [Nitrosopumilus sp.]
MNLIPAYPAPDFKEIEQWSDDSSYSIKDFKGKTVLLDFWTYTCIYCLRTIPVIKDIGKKYEDKGLVIIPIHSAEYEFAKNIKNIKKAIGTLDLRESLIGFDTKNKTWEIYGNSYWPKHILIDKEGFVRYEHPGYGKLKEFEEALSDLFDVPCSKNEPQEEDNQEFENNEITKIYGMHFTDMAPEICVGYSRLKRFGNNQKLKINDYNILIEPNTILDNNVYLRGKWRWDKDGIKVSLDHSEKNPSIIFKYNKASNVNIIIGPDNDKPAIAEIKIDDKYLKKEHQGYHLKMENGISYIEATWPFIYNVIKTKAREMHKIEIIPRSNNFCFYTFVFG